MIIPGIPASAGSNYNPYWDQVVLAMHMDGTNNGTVFTDLKGHAVTRYGNTVTKTGVKKYGTASAYFDGNVDYLRLEPSPDWNFGTKDFTIRTWKRRIAASSNDADGGPASIIISLDSGVSGSNTLLFLMYRNSLLFSSNNNSIVNSTPETWFNDEFYHLEAGRHDGVLMLFINGQKRLEAAHASAINGSSRRLNIGGRAYSANYNWYLNGYIDDLEVTNGVCLHTADFTPPTRAFPNK